MEYGKVYKEQKNILDNFEVDKANIILGRSIALLKLQSFFTVLEEKEKKQKIEGLYTLPWGTAHHSNYSLLFKGHMIEHPKSFMIVQNKEFLEEVLQTEEDEVFSFDFNVVQIDAQENGELLFRTYTKQQAKILSQNQDLRDFSLSI